MSSRSRYRPVPNWYTPTRPVRSLDFRLCQTGQIDLTVLRIRFRTPRVNGTVVPGLLGPFSIRLRGRSARSHGLQLLRDCTRTSSRPGSWHFEVTAQQVTN